MQNLGNMNDLYNVQDVILLCEIAENRFQFKNEINPRKCNSDSTLSQLLKEKCHVLLLYFQPLTKQLISFNRGF